MVYNTIYYLLYTLLRWNIGTVIDGTFYKESLRIKVKRIADKFNAVFLLIMITCPEDLIKERFQIREKREARTLSDADYDIYLQLKQRFQPTKLSHIDIDVISNKQDVMGIIEDAIRKRNS